MNARNALPLAGGVLLLALATSVLFVFNRNGEPPQPKVDLQAFKALPYIGHVEEPESRKDKVGVLVFDPARAYPGANLYCNSYERNRGAYLIAMNGRVIHEWKVPGENEWRSVTSDGEGNVVAHTLRKSPTTAYSPPDNPRLIKLDWNSNLLFEVHGEFHHDIQLLDDGRIVSLRAERIEIDYRGNKVPIVNDYLTYISEDGRVLNELSLFELVRGRPMVDHILTQAISGRGIGSSLDILHTNRCMVLGRSIEGFCEKGDILLCMRNLDLVLVVNPASGDIRWEHDGTGFLQHPHEPTLLDNGNILIFDNGNKRRYSRILEFDPMTLQTVWQYEAQPRHTFFTRARGSIQRFPNGNTLITESDSGRAFEVTYEGDIVWEWYNPIFSSNRPDKRGKRAIIYRMKRLEQAFVDGMIAQGSAPAR